VNVAALVPDNGPHVHAARQLERRYHLT
jgi:hypothetical protein